MAYSAKEICDRHGELKAKRAREEGEWREIAELIRPEEAHIGSGSKKDRTHDEIFDSTPLQALDDFKGGLFSQSTNPADRWFELSIADDDLKAWGPVKDYLWNFTQLIYASFGPAASAFYPMIPATFADLGAFGTGNFYTDLPQGAGRFTDVCTPLSESYIETDASGYLIRFHREFEWTGAQLQRAYGEAAKEFDDRSEYRIIHAVYENPDYERGRIGPRGMQYSSSYLRADGSGRFRVEKGYFEMPYVSIPWDLRPGRYARGPGHRARPDVNTLNEMERSHLTAGQFAAEGLFLTNDDSLISAADIEPRRLLHGAINDQGKRLFDRVEMGGELHLTMAQSEQRRDAIRKAFLFSIMQLVNRPQMTATEFLGFREEELRLMGPNLGRIHTYGLAPLIARRARILQRAGMVPPPPRELSGHNLDVSFTSPLAKAQKIGQARAIMQFAGQAIVWAQADPSVIDKCDFDKAMDAIGDGFGVPPGVVRSDDEVAKIREARAQQQAQAVQVEQAAQMSKVYADVAHANQAQTKSAQRTERAA